VSYGAIRPEKVYGGIESQRQADPAKNLNDVFLFLSHKIQYSFLHPLSRGVGGIFI
jgi:hypothetical protein